MISEEYKKMVLALPESFFEDWAYNDGDQVYLLQDIDDYTNSKERGLYTIFEDLIAHPGANYTENWMYLRWAKEENLIRPIPSQERLQKMIGLSPVEFIDDLFEYSHEPLNPSEVNEMFTTSMDSFTLAYVMWRKYGKYWNGEAWV